MANWKDKAVVRTKAMKEQEVELRQAKNIRAAEIDTAQEASGLKEISVQQAQAWIENKIDAAETVEETKAAIKEILLKMVPHVLLK